MTVERIGVCCCSTNYLMLLPQDPYRRFSLSSRSNSILAMLPSLPPELIANILHLCVPSSLKIEELEQSGLSPLEPFTRFALVSSAFLFPAQVILYRTIKLWHSPVDKLDILEPSNALAAMMVDSEDATNSSETFQLTSGVLPTLSTALLLRSIKKSPAIAALVHTVSFGTVWSARGDEAERCEAAMLRVVMLACPNIRGMDLELLNYWPTILSSSHIKDVVVADCRARTSLTALNLVVDRMDDMKLLKDLNSLKRVRLSFYNFDAPNCVLQAIEEREVPSPSFRLEALHLVCPASHLQSTFNFLTASSRHSLHSLNITWDEEPLPSDFSVSAVPNLLHLKLSRQDSDTYSLTYFNTIIRNVSLLNKLRLLYIDFACYPSPSSAPHIAATKHLRNLPSTLHTLGVHFQAISLPTLVNQLRDPSFLPALRDLDHDFGGWLEQADFDVEMLDDLIQVCRERGIVLKGEQWKLEIV